MQKAVEHVLETAKSNYETSMHPRRTDTPREISEQMIQKYNEGIHYVVGNKYVKILTSGSVHSFIVNTENDKKFPYGTILKAASYNAPARNINRGSIFNNADVATRICWTGVNY